MYHSAVKTQTESGFTPFLK